MKIDKDTLYITVEPLLRAAGESYTAEIERAAVAEYLGADGYWSITIDQLSQMIDGNDMTAIVKTIDPLKMTVFEVYIIRGLQAFLIDYIKKLEKLVPVKTNEEKAAEGVCLKMTLTEGLLIFAREYFNLPNFKAAGQITLADLLIAKKDTYNKAMYQRKLADIYNRKAKR